jgi:hypothetical protein
MALLLTSNTTPCVSSALIKSSCRTHYRWYDRAAPKTVGRMIPTIQFWNVPRRVAGKHGTKYIIKSMVFDLIYFLLFLGGLQLPQYWKNLPGGGFIIAFALPLFWGLSAGLGFVYPFIRRSGQPLHESLRVTVVLLLSFVTDFVIYRSGHSGEVVEVSLRSTLYFFVVPSTLLTFVSALAGGSLTKSKRAGIEARSQDSK